MDRRTYIQIAYNIADVRSILGINGIEHDQKWKEYMGSLHHVAYWALG